MPDLKAAIEGCAYNPHSKIMGFRYLNRGVIVEARKITINETEDEETAKKVIVWLKGVLTSKGLKNGE